MISLTHSFPAILINRNAISFHSTSLEPIRTSLTGSVQQTPPPLAKESPRSRFISKSVDSSISPESSPPPSPPVRHVSSSIPPDVKPRYSSRSFSNTSPVKQVTPAAAATATATALAVTTTTTTSAFASNKAHQIEPPERRKRSIDLIDECTSVTTPPAVEYAEVRKHSIDLTSSFASPQTQPISSSPSSGLSISSGPSSPNHTEDEKQENESNEKTDLFDEIITECKSKN